MGFDNIDLEKAHEYGVKVTNAPGLNSNAVAELAIGLILGALRNIPSLHSSARKGYWDRFVGKEIIGRNIGLLGFGSIEKFQGSRSH